MQQIEKFKEFEQAVQRLDPDLAQHLGGALFAIIAGVGVLALIVSAMTANLPFAVPVL